MVIMTLAATLVAISTIVKFVTTALLSIKKIDLRTSYFLSFFTALPFIAHNRLIGENWQMLHWISVLSFCAIGWFFWRKKEGTITITITTIATKDESTRPFFFNF